MFYVGLQGYPRNKKSHILIHVCNENFLNPLIYRLPVPSNIWNDILSFFPVFVYQNKVCESHCLILCQKHCTETTKEWSIWHTDISVASLTILLLSSFQCFCEPEESNSVTRKLYIDIRETNRTL